MERSELVQIQGRLKVQRDVAETLLPHVIPFLAARGSIFQQARPQVAQLTMKFISDNNGPTIP